MSYDNPNISVFYSSDEYIKRNPDLDEKDSPWKITKIIPLIDTYFIHTCPSAINLLDVGGGAGIILKGIASYIEQNKKIRVRKFALDLSPGMLNIQKHNNPDLVKALNEDITKTSLDDKEVDLTLMIDVLEHVPHPLEALNELQRISKFIIFKVPMENNLYSRAQNLLHGGKPRQYFIDKVGHINLYRFSALKRQLEMHAGSVIDSYFTNVFDYELISPHYRDNWGMKSRLLRVVARNIFKMSPRMSSMLFGDFALFLVKTHEK